MIDCLEGMVLRLKETDLNGTSLPSFSDEMRVGKRRIHRSKAKEPGAVMALEGEAHNWERLRIECGEAITTQYQVGFEDKIQIDPYLVDE